MSWRVAFNELEPVTAWIVSKDIPISTSLDFVPTRVATEAEFSNLEHSEAIESSIDSAKE